MEEDWQEDLESWLESYLQNPGNKTRRRMCGLRGIELLTSAVPWHQMEQIEASN